MNDINQERMQYESKKKIDFEKIKNKREKDFNKIKEDLQNRSN